MLSNIDYFIVGIYLLFLASMGWIFKRFNKTTNDYFAGGFRMSWWLVGATALITNVSCWLFTGASEIAYDYGWLILAFYFNDLIGFFLAAIYFAPRFRQLRVVTAIDAVRLRFGRVNEQFFNWIQILGAFLQSAVGLVGLSVILSAVFPVNQERVIIVTGSVVLVIALLGGSWGVAGSGFVQFTMLTCMTVLVAVMTLVRIGGVHAFFAQIPADHWQIFRPAGSTKYDWVFIVTGWMASVYWRNNLGVTSKYVAARDSVHARKAALVPVLGYLILPLFWFVPPMAAHTLVPTLVGDYASMSTPEEASYFAVCKLVLPHGLLGLMVATMFSVTMASMDSALNKNAALFVKNFYQSLIRKNASDRELYIAGCIATFVCGVLTIMLATLFTGKGKASLFDLYQYLNAYLWMPVGVTLALAIWVKRTPRWAAWATVLWGVLVSVFMYQAIPTSPMQRLFTPILGERFYHYLVTNPFAATNFIAIPLTTLFFFGTKLFYDPAKHQGYERQVDRFFKRMETPVDFEKEVGNDNSVAQARLLSRVMAVYALLMSLILLIPNSLEGRIGIAACSAAMFGIAGGMRLYVRYLGRASAALRPSPAGADAVTTVRA